MSEARLRGTIFMLGALAAVAAMLLWRLGLQAPLAWLSAGLAAALLVRHGYGYAAWFALGSTAGGVLMGQALPQALAMGLATAGPALLALHLQRSQFDPAFRRERDFLRFVVAAAPATALGAAIATLLPALVDAAHLKGGIARTWLQWWMTAYLGTLLVVPMVVAASREDLRELRRQAPQLLLLLTATALVVALAMVAPTPTHGFVVGPLSLVLVGFAALRFHVSVAAAVAGVLTCAIGLSAAAAPVSEYVSAMFGLARASAFGLVNALVIFTVQVLRSERLAALRALQDAELRHRAAILQAARREQLRIGELLHDEVGQEATALSLLARSIERRLEQGVGVQPSDAQAIVEGTKRIHVATRNAVQRLLAVEAHNGSLAEALDALVGRLRQAGAPPIHLDLPQDLQDLDPEVAEVLFRTAQEALTNAVKHARASRIDVVMRQSDTGLELRISDDGIGLIAHAPLEGVGLRIMRGRAEQVGGRLSSRSAMASGTEIVLEIPAPPAGFDS